MQYHKEQIMKANGWIALYSFFAGTILLIAVAALLKSADTLFLIIPILAFMGYMIWQEISKRQMIVRHYKKAKAAGVVEMLKDTNPYSTMGEMNAAIRREKQNVLYEDDEIFVTESFIGSGNYAMLIDGILDATIDMHVTRGGAVYEVVLEILYYTGVKNTFQYRKPFMGPWKPSEIRKNLKGVIDIISQKSPHFRKYSYCRLLTHE